MAKKGMVYLIGAGPGDPTLFTIKGIKALSRADAVVYDNLVNPLLLRYAKDSAKLIYAGKQAGIHSMSQDEINKVLIQLAKEGLIVARLKGGDPFIFGRGGEEALALAEEGISFEIIPGITSAISVPTYAGIPLTHRRYSSSVTFVTGHEDPLKKDSFVCWKSIAGCGGTIVILMGVGNLEKIKKRLIKEGLSAETPFAIICNGTLPTQKVVQGRLSDMDTLAKEEHVKAPAIVVIGNVVKLREQISWFEKKPLFGKKIIITRPEEQADELFYPLMDAGADCILFPTIKIAAAEEVSLLDKAINELQKYDWIIFTSANGVRFFFDRIKELNKDARIFGNSKICAIGPKTAEALRNRFIVPDLVPEEYRSEDIVRCFSRIQIKGKRFLIPRADNARDLLPKELRKMGAKVDVVTAYRNILPEIEEQKREKIRQMIIKEEVDLVIFTSPSTFYNFLKLVDISEEKAKNYFKHINIACIGPVTAGAIKRAGLKPKIMPKKYDIPHLVEAIIAYYEMDRAKQE